MHVYRRTGGGDNSQTDSLINMHTEILVEIACPSFKSIVYSNTNLLEMQMYVTVTSVFVLIATEVPKMSVSLGSHWGIKTRTQTYLI